MKKLLNSYIVLVMFVFPIFRYPNPPRNISVCPENFIPVLLDEDTFLDDTGSRKIGILSGVGIYILLDNTHISVINLLPSPHQQTILQYAYDGQTYQITVINTHGSICFIESSVNAVPFATGLFSPFDHERSTYIKNDFGVNLILSISDSGKEIGVIRNGRVVIAQAVNPQRGYQIALTFTIDQVDYTVIAVNNNGKYAYRMCHCLMVTAIGYDHVDLRTKPLLIHVLKAAFFTENCKKPEIIWYHQHMEYVRKIIDRYHFRFFLLYLLVLSILYSILSITRHNHFESGGFDLGLYDQAVWKFANFAGAYNTVKERIIFGDHLVLTLPLFGILFYLWDNVRILLIAQAVIIATSAIPIYLIAKKRLNMPLVAVAIGFLYSIFYGIQYGVFFDFHPIIIGTAVISWLAYFWESGKPKWFWSTLVFAFLTQENMGIAVACLSAIFFFRKEFQKRAIVVGILGLTWSLVASKIIAQFSPIGFQYWPQFPSGPSDAVARLFDSDEKRQVWLNNYAQFSFVPLFSPGSLIAVLIDLSQYFVTGPEFSRMWSPFMHHRAILAPFLVLGVIDVCVFLHKKKLPVHVLIVLMLGVAGFFQFYFHLPLNKLSKSEYWKYEAWMSDNTELIATVPKGASVATQQNFVPHLSHRNEVYIAWPRQHDIVGKPCGQSLCRWLDFGGKPEYLVVDTRPHQWVTQTLESDENWNSAIQNMEKTGRITFEKQVGDAKLYKIWYTKNLMR